MSDTVIEATLSGSTANGAAVARPVILSVDDDPGVSRAVARDLRRRYGGRAGGSCAPSPVWTRWTR